ncbi:putative juvenile hormone binding protein, partial [Trypoxylus dichotomus]
LDIKEGKAEFTLSLDRLEVEALAYSFTSGMLLGLPVSGNGKFNMTMVGITVNYSSDSKIYDKGDDTYLSLANGRTSTDMERGYYYFENLQSPKEGDINKYIDDHWEEFRIQMKPTIEFYLTKYIHTPVAKIFSEVPMDKIFLP